MNSGNQSALLRAAVAVIAAGLSLCASAAPADDRIAWHFKGRIDGSERIEVTGESVRWRHVAWGWPPEPVTLDGIEWEPRSQPSLVTNELPGPVDFSTARLELIRARDAVALERSASGITLFISDTPCGSDVYEFRIVFEPRATKRHAPARASVVLNIRAVVDGSDRLLVTPREAMWIHRHWGWPTEVSLNGVLWNPSRRDRLGNRGRTTFLPPSVDFGSVSVVTRRGRDLLAVEPVPAGLLIHFADNPNGAATYDVSIRLGLLRPEPPLEASSGPARKMDPQNSRPLSTRPGHLREPWRAGPSSFAARRPASPGPKLPANSNHVDLTRERPVTLAGSGPTRVGVSRSGRAGGTLASTPSGAGERMVAPGEAVSPSADGGRPVSSTSRSHGTGTEFEAAYAQGRVQLIGAGAPRPGEAVGLNLTAVRSRGLGYRLASSLGTGPIQIANRQIGLSPDWLFLVSAGGVLPSIFASYAGTMDQQGTARATINIPNDSKLIGARIHTAYVTLDAAAPFGIRSISNTVSFSIAK